MADGDEQPADLAAAQQQIQNLQAQLQALQRPPQQQQQAAPQPQAESARVPKLPAFITQDPTFWFLQAELAFESSNITREKTKATYVLGALEYDVGKHCRSIVENPNITDPYTKIKEKLIGIYAASDEKQIRQLLKGQFLSDGKPSLILDRINSLNKDQRVSKEVVKTIFLDHLDPVVRGILVTNNYDSIEKMALAADVAIDIMSHSP